MKTNNLDIKVGDKIVCHTICIVEGTEKSTTVGKFYTILGLRYDNQFYIIDDCNDTHYFYDKGSLDKNDYKKWFYPPLKQQRKDKLKKLLTINE